MIRIRKQHALASTIAVAIACTAAGALAGNPAPQYGNWGDPQNVVSVNSLAAEGCPIESPDGHELYIASSRSAPGAQGKLDIYRAHRIYHGRHSGSGLTWGAPENLGAQVNSPEFDYCPTPLGYRSLLFVSSRATDDDCYPGNEPPPAPPGGPAAGDIYLTAEFGQGRWLPPLHLGCYPHGPNTAGAEFSPSLVHTLVGTYVYFSSNGYPDSLGQDIYKSRVLHDGTVLPGIRVDELSSSADDRMPNVRRDGLEIVFSSNRAGATPFDQDIYVATRPNVWSRWSAPVRIDNPFLNTSGSETRASLSGDGTRLYFGRKTTSDDPGDIFVSERMRSR